MQFSISSGVNYREFEGKVNEKLRNGWQLWGNPFYDPKFGRYCQATIKNQNGVPMQFVLCIGANHREFEEKVNEILQEGWQLWGNPFYDPKFGQYCQAVIKTN